MAASNINRVVLTGNLTRDPELRSLQSGTSVCSLRIASNSRRKENGEWVDKPNYFSVTVWGAQGENCARFLSKGRPVCIDGRLDWREWQGQDGQKRESVEIVAESVQFLGSRDDNGGGGVAAARAAASSTTTASRRTPTSPRTRRTSRPRPSAPARRPRTTTSRSRPREAAVRVSKGRRWAALRRSGPAASENSNSSIEEGAGFVRWIVLPLGRPVVRAARPRTPFRLTVKVRATETVGDRARIRSARPFSNIAARSSWRIRRGGYKGKESCQSCPP